MNWQRMVRRRTRRGLSRIDACCVACVLAWWGAVPGSGLCGSGLCQEPAEQQGAEVASPVARGALERFQAWVGEWRGVAQPKRGSAKDAWSEECQWAWTFSDGRPALTWKSPQGKWVRSARLESTGERSFRLTASTPAGDLVEFSGSVDDQGTLVLLAKGSRSNPDLNEKPSSAAGPTRITLRTVAGGDRFLVLYERQGGTNQFLRLAEVGYTRKGSGFGAGASYVECVVTGGAGTIPVSHKGQTYYVCCGGCRDYFNDNPEQVLAEYRARQAAKKGAAR